MQYCFKIIQILINLHGAQLAGGEVVEYADCISAER